MAPDNRRFYDLRRRPYLLLFPVAVALAWWGVSHWLLHAGGWLADYRPRFHALAQTQGFMTCLVLGFLLTMIPRRTRTAPPALALVAFVAAAPALAVALAWEDHWVAAQGAWLAALLALVAFIARRAGGEGEPRLPNGFVWLPAALLMAITGGLAIIVAELGAGSQWRQLGEGLTQQGFLIGIVLGVGGALVLPLMTRDARPASGPLTWRDHLARFLHLSGAVVFAVSFWLEQTVSLPLAMALRAGVTTAVLLGCAELWRRPRRPGLTAHVIWISAWLVPVGYALAAAAPYRFRAGLHVTLVGGLALLGLLASLLIALVGGAILVLLSLPVLIVVAILGLVFAPILLPIVLLLMLIGMVIKGIGLAFAF